MTYVGQPVKRFEDAPLVTGQGRFLDDVPLPGMLYAAMVRSDYAHARIRSVDTSAARDLLGVVEVLVASNIAGTLEDIPSRPMACEQMIQEMHPPTHPVLAKDKVCYAGQAIAIVVAQDHYIAAEAIELISVDYEPIRACSSSCNMAVTDSSRSFPVVTAPCPCIKIALSPPIRVARSIPSSSVWMVLTWG